MKILVVDDTEANRKLLAWMLEDDGHEVIEAVNGQQAVERFNRHMFCMTNAFNHLSS